MVSADEQQLKVLDLRPQQVADIQEMASRYSTTSSCTGGGSNPASSGAYSSSASVDDKAFAYCDSFARESSPVSTGGGAKSTANWMNSTQVTPAQPQPAQLQQQQQQQQQQPQKFTTERRASTPRSTSSGVSSPRSSTATSNTSNLSQSSFSFSAGSGGEMVSAAGGGGGRSGSITSLQQQPMQHAHDFNSSGGVGVGGAAPQSVSLDNLDGSITGLLRMYDEFNALINSYTFAEQMLSTNCESGRAKLANNSEEIMKLVHNYANMRRLELDAWHAQHMKELQKLSKDANTQRERIKAMVEQLQHAKRFYEKQPDQVSQQIDNSTKQCVRAAEEMKMTEQPLLVQQQAQVKMLALRYKLNFMADVETFRSNIHKFGGYFMDQLSIQQQQQQQAADVNKNGSVSAGSSGLASHIGSSSSSGCNSNSSDANSGHTSPTAMTALQTSGAVANGQRHDEVDAGGVKRPFPAPISIASDFKFGCAPTSLHFDGQQAQSEEMSQLLPFRNAITDSAILSNGTANIHGSTDWAEAANENAERMALGSRNYVASSTSASQQLNRSTSVQQSPPHSHVGSTSRLVESAVVSRREAELNSIGRSVSCSKFGFAGITPVAAGGAATSQHATGFGDGSGWLQLSNGFDSNSGSGNGSLMDSSTFGSTSTLSLNTSSNNAACDLTNSHSSMESRMTGTVPLTPASSSSAQRTVRRHKIRFSYKIGSDKPSVDPGKFSEPSGVVATPNGELIVADTNNHRIQVFNSDGTFKLQFGEAGRRPGQLLYPNRVAYCVCTKRIVITERAPTHQVQAFTEDGHFEAKFGADILEHPRGVTVDHLGQIIIVECRIMRVVIFNRNGDVLKQFKCQNLEFPNGVAVDKHERIFISDNRAHCVRVFNYAGQYIQDIGGGNLTNYPIGVCVTPNGNVLVADNHNNFNITLFTPEGELLEFYESSVKHAQCLDIALIDEGVVALASKDFKVYVYPFGHGATTAMSSITFGGGIAADNNNDIDLSLSFRAHTQQQPLHHHQQQMTSSGGIERSPASMRHHLQQRMNIVAGSSTPNNNQRRDQYYDGFSQQQRGQQVVGMHADDTNTLKYSQHPYHQHQQLSSHHHRAAATTPTSENIHSVFDFPPLVASPDQQVHMSSNGYGGTADNAFSYGSRHQQQQQQQHEVVGGSFDSPHYSNNNHTKMSSNYCYSNDYNTANNVAEDVFALNTVQQSTHHQHMPQTYSNYDQSNSQYNHVAGLQQSGDTGHFYSTKTENAGSNFRLPHQQQQQQNNMYAEQQYMNSASPFGASQPFKQAMQNVSTGNSYGMRTGTGQQQQQPSNGYTNSFAIQHNMPRTALSCFTSGCGTNAAQQLHSAAWGAAADYGSGDDLDVTSLTSSFHKNMMMSAGDDAVAGSGGLYGSGEKKNFLDD